MDQRIRVVLGMIQDKAVKLDPCLVTTARMMNISAPGLRRLFKREIGVAFRDYLRSQRMSQAAKLSADETLSIKQIALESGYSDVSNFYRDFKKVHGLPPGQLRSQTVVRQK